MNRLPQSSSLSPQSFSEGDWVLVRPQQMLGKVIEKSALWGNSSFRIWLPSSDSIIRVDASALSPAQSSYGYLKDMRARPILVAILVSWGVAFFEFCLQVPANWLGSHYFSLPQLKVIQEVVTMLVFALFCVFYMKQKLSWDYFWASPYLVAAAFFMFRQMASSS
mgnify:CR=1 FL=1